MISQDYKKAKIESGEIIELMEEIREDMGLSHSDVRRIIKNTAYYNLTRGTGCLDCLMPKSRKSIEKLFDLEQGALSNATDKHILEVFRKGDYKKTIELIALNRYISRAGLKEITSINLYTKIPFTVELVKYTCDKLGYNSDKLGIQNIKGKAPTTRREMIDEKAKEIECTSFTYPKKQVYPKSYINKRVKVMIPIDKRTLKDNNKLTFKIKKGIVAYIDNDIVCIKTDYGYKECYLNNTSITKIQLI